MRLFGLVLFAALLTVSSVVRAEKILGKVVITNELRESLAEEEKKKSEANRAYYWNEPNGIASVRLPIVNPSRDIAVVITREGAEPPKPNNVETVKVFAGSMERNVIVTRPGSTLKFKNVDPYDHALYAGGVADFPAEQQSNGMLRAVEFKEEGVFEVKCKLVPHFRAYVVVTKATLIADVKSDGTFTVNDIEPGKYLIRVFHNGKWIYSKSLSVGNGQPKDAKLEISLKPAAPAEEAKAEEKDEKKDEKK